MLRGVAVAPLVQLSLSGELSINPGYRAVAPVSDARYGHARLGQSSRFGAPRQRVLLVARRKPTVPDRESRIAARSLACAQDARAAVHDVERPLRRRDQDPVGHSGVAATRENLTILVRMFTELLHVDDELTRQFR